MSPPRTVLTLWQVDARRVPAAVTRMALDRRHLRRVPGLRFAKLLGTGDGRTFTLRDADLLHWGLLSVWDDDQMWHRFTAGPTYRAWDRLAEERLDVMLVPLASRGRWSGQAPFDDEPRPGRSRLARGSPVTNDPQQGSPVTNGPGAGPRLGAGPVAAITRARLRLTRAHRFWRAVPPVSADLREAPGLVLAVGIGEAPVGLQGTFSLWRDAAALRDFAYRRAAHADVVARTAREGWYAEELFARFRVEHLHGTFRGVEPLSTPDAAGGG